MASRRMLARNITQSKKVSNLPDPWAKLLFTWLLPFTDDYGRFHADADLVKAAVFPREHRLEIKHVEKLLSQLSSAGLIGIYENGNSRYLEILDFDKYQTFRVDRPRQSEYPEPLKDDDGIPRYANGLSVVLPKLREFKLSEDNLLVEKEIFDYWNSLENLITHREFTEAFASSIHSKLKNFTKDEICDAIESYDDILGNPDYLLEYKWKIDEFLQRKLEKFINESKPHESWPHDGETPELDGGNDAESQKKK